MSIRGLTSAFLTAFALSALTIAQQIGTIRGTVVDEQGKAVVDARIQVEPLGVIMHTLVREVNTDKIGRFAMEGLQFGSYKVFAMKESAGYPNTAFAFYSNQVFSTVTLLANAPTADLVLKVGPPAGIISGRV